MVTYVLRLTSDYQAVIVRVVRKANALGVMNLDLLYLSA